MSKFQIITISICIVVGLVAVLIFAGVLPGFQGAGKNQNQGADLVIWGTFSERDVLNILSDFNDENDPMKARYVEKNKETYEIELLDALASGTGPDMWIISQELLLKHKNKIFGLSFSSYSERQFKDTFTNPFEVFIDSKKENISAIPLIADPLILFWNKDIFSSAGVAKPPQYWDEFLTSVEKLTKIDQSKGIIQSGAGFGEFRNVRNAKEIISLLILQTGNVIVDKNELNSVINEKQDQGLNPAENAIRFFNDFSNPNKTSYTWNKALSDDQTMFANGFLAMYFGYASDYGQIKKKNPHLNFDAAEVPQIRDGTLKTTYAKVYALAVSKNSSQSSQAFTAASVLSGAKYDKMFSDVFGLGPARRDILAEPVNNPILSVIYKSTIMAKTWLDPDSKSTYEIFKNMIESTASGRMKVYDAVSGAQTQLRNLLQQYE